MIALVIRLSWLNFHDAMSVLVFDSVCEFIVKDKQIMFILPDADQVTCHLFNAVSFMPKGYWCGFDVDWCHYRRCYRNQTQMEPEAKKQLLVPSLPHPLLYTLHFYPSPLILFTFSISAFSSLIVSSHTLNAVISTTSRHSPLKLCPLCCLHHGHYGVCDWGPNVGAHDDWNGRPHF